MLILHCTILLFQCQRKVSKFRVFNYATCLTTIDIHASQALCRLNLRHDLQFNLAHPLFVQKKKEKEKKIPNISTSDKS